MIVIHCKGAEKEEFAESIVSNDGANLKVKVRFKDGREAIDTYPVANVLRYREIPDEKQN